MSDEQRDAILREGARRNDRLRLIAYVMLGFVVLSIVLTLGFSVYSTIQGEHSRTDIKQLLERQTQSSAAGRQSLIDAFARLNEGEQVSRADALAFLNYTNAVANARRLGLPIPPPPVLPSIPASVYVPPGPPPRVPQAPPASPIPESRLP